MAKIYANLIRQDVWTMEQVPDKWKAATQAELDKDN
jgi:hypothetical protein